MFIGVSLGYNTSAVVIDPSKGIKLAISEERLIGEKNTKKFPINAIKECIKFIKPEDGNVLTIGISSYEVINWRTIRYMDLSEQEVQQAKQLYGNFYSFLVDYIKAECFIPSHTQVNIERVEHHEAHRIPAVYMSGFLQDEIRTIAITADGFGDGVFATIYDCRTKELLSREYIDCSLGLVYQYVTGALGFKEHQHEGKITGLAALGEPKFVEQFKHFLIGYDKEKMSFIPNYLYRGWVNDSLKNIPLNKNIYGFDNMLTLKEKTYTLVKHLKGIGSDADIAASVQAYTEELITEWIKDVIIYNGIDRFNMVLSGGIFANVKVNYKVKKVVGPDNLFILPPMGDEGTAIGAAIKVAINAKGENAINLQAFGKDNLYLGSIKSDNILLNFNIDHEKYEVIDLDMADFNLVQGILMKVLSNEKILCVSMGNSEFGPRALGNHSILFDASKKETNDSLNKRLSRTEFMPFAPITIDAFCDDLFLDTEGLEKTLKYMTIAVPVTEEFKEGYKAAYHIDFTARPQVLHYQDNSIVYNIIKDYYNLTNKKALINTSFNLHNHPIIFDDIVAYESFVKADLDALLLDDLLIVKRECL